MYHRSANPYMVLESVFVNAITPQSRFTVLKTLNRKTTGQSLKLQRLERHHESTFFMPLQLPASCRSLQNSRQGHSPSASVNVSSLPSHRPFRSNKTAQRNQVASQLSTKQHSRLQVKCSSSSGEDLPEPNHDEASKLLDALQKQPCIGSEYGEVGMQ